MIKISNSRIIFKISIIFTFILLHAVNLQPQIVVSPMSVTQGKAKKILEDNLLPTCQGSRVSSVGEIIAIDGTSWIVPSENLYKTARKATDLYNDCTGIQLPNSASLNINTVPIVDIDADGEIVTGYIFADNYFEFYVNGVLIAVDPVPFTPFNSNVIRFKVKQPYTIAVKLVDWEENLGIGSENNQGDMYHPGDGGFIASFSDGTVTDTTWVAQTFYIAPLISPASVTEKLDGTRSTEGVTTNPSCGDGCYAVHYPIPEQWTLTTFDDRQWPKASVFSEATVGVNNKPAYTNFIEKFSGSGAQFVWSSNLVLDNLVLVRKTVGTTTSVPMQRISELPPEFIVMPNLLSETINISFNLLRAETIKIDLFNQDGKHVTNVINQNFDRGHNTILWSYNNLKDMFISSGIYFFRLQCSNAVIAKPITVIR